MLIRGKSHSRDESRNSRVSIKTLSFARIGTFTCAIGVGSPAGAREGGDHRPDPAPFPAVFALPGRLSGITMVIGSLRQKHLFPLLPTT